MKGYLYYILLLELSHKHSTLKTNHLPKLNLERFFPKQFTVRGSQFFLKMCPPFVSLLVSALFRWPCSISIHLSPRSVTAWWCPPFSAGHVAFLCICLPGLSLLVSALFRWPCSISIHLSPRSVTAGVHPLPLAMQHFYSFVSQVCHSVTGGVRPFPLAMQHFYSFVS